MCFENQEYPDRDLVSNVPIDRRSRDPNNTSVVEPSSLADLAAAVPFGGGKGKKKVMAVEAWTHGERKEEKVVPHHMAASTSPLPLCRGSSRVVPGLHFLSTPVGARLHSWRLLGPRRYLHGHCTNSMRILLHQPPVCFYYHSSTSIPCPPSAPLPRIWFSLHHDARRASMDSTRRRVLLVEDAEVNRMVVRRLLSEFNMILEEAENGKIAVDFIKQGRTYDLIFMDKEMPVMNGHEATKQLRLLGVTTPIIALSSDCLPCDRDLFIQAGANAFQAKPLSKTELVRILTKYGLLTSS